ncbi:MAG: citrate synthase [Chitinophagales bacterium]|nr:citrate synthase [Chitinophagales bacterium]
MAETVRLQYGDNTYEYPLIKGSENELAIDISKLRDETGLITMDVGYKNTGATTSRITFLDGEEGILRYCGYPIEDLAASCSFMEVCYLLFFNELPNAEQLKSFETKISRHTLVHEDMKKIFEAYPTNSHPMGQIIAMVSSLSSFYPNSLNPNRSEDDKQLTMFRLLAKMPTIVAMTHKKAIGHPVMYPDNKLDYVSNFLKMTFGNVTEEYEPDAVVVDAMNKLLILHADHEQNCSTSTVRIVGSSQANLYAAAAAGIAALWGPLHGGANQQVLEMLEMIKADGSDVNKWVEKAKDKSSNFRLSGFGHRVYKNFDPRATIIKEACDNVLNKMGIQDEILEIAKKLEEVALKDSYFVERKLYPNVDFYSGIIYRAIGFPVEMFTVLFALGRLPGWIAQWKEMVDQKQPIGRPRQIYTGYAKRDFVEMTNRK